MPKYFAPIERPRQTFGIYDSGQLLQKIERELADLERCQDFVRSGDHAFNICLSLWHMTDWVFADMNQEERHIVAKLINGKFDRSTAFGVAVQRAFPLIRICRTMATAGKHVIVDKYPDPSVETMIDIYEKVGQSDDQYVFRWGMTFNGKQYDATDVFHRVADFWRSIFSALGWK